MSFERSFPRGPARDARANLRLNLLRVIGRFYSKPRVVDPRRSLLLIRPDHLGDVLFLTPALHALRAALPAARITLLVGPWGKPVVESNPDADEILVHHFPGFERKGQQGVLAPYRKLSALGRSLRARRFDAAVVLRFDHWWGAWLAAVAGVPLRIGYDHPETLPFLTLGLPYVRDRHEVQQNATLLAVLASSVGADVGPTRYSVSEADRLWAERALSLFQPSGGRPWVAIHPGSGASIKQWPTDYWAAVADTLVESYGAEILLTGSESEKPLCHELAGKMRTVPQLFAGRTSLGQLAALYARCALVMGSDCGPLHLAVAMGVRSIHLHGPVSPIKFGPWGDPGRHVVLSASWTCAPCDRLDWDRASLPQHACMTSIAPGDLLPIADRLLAEARGKERVSAQGVL